MARERIVKFPPKRGKLTKRQVERAVRKVIRERLEREAMEAEGQPDSTVSTPELPPKTA